MVRNRDYDNTDIAMTASASTQAVSHSQNPHRCRNPITHRAFTAEDSRLSAVCTDSPAASVIAEYRSVPGVSISMQA